MDKGKSFAEYAQLSPWQINNIVFHPRESDGSLRKPRKKVPKGTQRRKNATVAEAVATAKRLGQQFRVRKDKLRAHVERILDKWGATPEERAEHLREFPPSPTVKGERDGKPKRPPGKPAGPAARPKPKR